MKLFEKAYGNDLCQVRDIIVTDTKVNNIYCICSRVQDDVLHPLK